MGSGKFSVGPAVMLVYQPEQWTVSLEMQQIWSVIGSSGREEVSQMLGEFGFHWDTEVSTWKKTELEPDEVH